MRTKTLLGIILLLACISMNAVAQSSAGLIASWPMNASFADVSGNGHNGTAYFVANGAGRTGSSNTAMIFNGASSYIDIPYQADLNVNTSNNYTICAIVKPMGYNTDTTCQRSHIFARGALATTGSYSMYYFDGAYDNNNCVTFDTSKNVFAASAGMTSGGNFASAWQYTPRIVSNTWYTVCVTYSGNRMKVFVDGVQKSSYNMGGGPGIGSSTDGAVIGANFDPTNSNRPNWFKGYIDDMRIYSRVLADSEIMEYHNGVYLPPITTPFCPGATFQLTYNTFGTFRAGNTFRAELSDASGSFASPTTLGTVTSTTAGTINCSIPGSLPTGTGYKVRVIATNPAKISEETSVIIGTVTTTPPGAAIVVIPGTIVSSGISVLFSSSVSLGGPTPTYQWMKNGSPIPGATNSTFTGISGIDFVSNDTIYVVVRTSIPCTTPDSAASNKIVMTVNNTGIENNSLNNLSLYPNPNRGTLTLRGSVATGKELTAEVVNVTGQVVYTTAIPVNNFTVNKQINLGDNIANGIYIMRINTGDETRTIRFAVEK